MDDFHNKERTGRWGKHWYISAIDGDGFDVHGANGILTWKSTWQEAWDECKKRTAQDEGDLQHVPNCECCGSEMFWTSEWENQAYWECKICEHVEWMSCETTTDDTPPGSE